MKFLNQTSYKKSLPVQSNDKNKTKTLANTRILIKICDYLFESIYINPFRCDVWLYMIGLV